MASGPGDIESADRGTIATNTHPVAETLVITWSKTGIVFVGNRWKRKSQIALFGAGANGYRAMGIFAIVFAKGLVFATCSGSASGYMEMIS